MPLKVRTAIITVYFYLNKDRMLDLWFRDIYQTVSPEFTVQSCDYCVFECKDNLNITRFLILL